MNTHPDDAESGKPTVPQPQSQDHSESSSKKIMHPPSSDAIPIRINADDQKKWKLVCYSSIIILVIVFLSLMAGLALPKALIQVNQREWVQGSSVQSCDTHVSLVNTTITCASGSGNNYTSMGAFVTNLSPLNQFLVLYLAIKPAYYDREVTLDQDANFTLYTAQRVAKGPNSIIEMKVTGQISTTNISLRGKVKDLFPNNQFFILYMSKLSKGDYFYWEVSFSNNSQIKPGTYYLSSQIVNPNFSYFTIFLRVGLFIISFAVFLKYNQLILALPKERVSVEQRAVQVLSVITLAFNDQLYFVSVIAPNAFSSFLSSFFLWNFLAYLFILWALFLNRIRNPEPQTSTFLLNLPSGIVTFVFYAVGMGYSVAYAITQTTIHPVFSFEDVTAPGVVAMQIITFIAVSLGCIYIIYLFIYILKYKPNRPYRHTIFMAISAVFFICTAVFFFVGGYDLYAYSASKIIFTLCFMNMYSFFLQYLFAPTTRQIRSLNRESVPLAAMDLEMPDGGEVLVDITDQSQKEKQAREKIDSSINSQENEQSKSGTLSARQRRKKHRKLRNLNKSKQNSDIGGTNQQINNKNKSLDNPNEDEFS